MTVSAFVEHCREGARRFVQTAIVIDDEAVLSTPPEEPDPPIRRAARRSGSVIEVVENPRRPESDRVPLEEAGQQDMPRDLVNSGAMTEQQHYSEARGTPETETAVPSGTTRPEHDVAVDERVRSNALNAKALTDAFLKQAVICGLYKPDPGEQIVDVSRNAALHADVIVVDWYLEGQNSQKAKEIICDVLREDLKENGRLRLITVYTSQPGCAALASELFEELERDTHLQGRLTLSGPIIPHVFGYAHLLF
jgi:Response receiver domain